MSETVTENIDKAGEGYWTQVWENSPLPEAINPRSKNINKYTYIRIHQYFSKLFENIETKGKTLLEIGCGNSVWLPYLAKEFGFKIYGLDYSEQGCITSRRILERENVQGEIIKADFFNPPKELLGKFDFVISLGVAEHFTNTADVIKVFSDFLKPKGILITEIPNLSGLIGFLQKKLNKPVYDIHVPLNKNELEDATKKAGLDIIDSSYLLSVAFPVTLEGKDGKIPNYKLKKHFVLTLSRISKVFWLMEKAFGSFPERKLLSANIICVARKP